VLPGGVANPDFLRMDDDAVSFVRSFFEAGKPVAVICHGPWTLVEADVVRDRKLTSWPSLQTDISATSWPRRSARAGTRSRPRARRAERLVKWRLRARGSE
jgi:putative intracellular protease/amidase